MEGKKLILYLDTSVIGGYYDNEFLQDTQRLFQAIKNNEYEVAISDLTLKELVKAPSRVKTLLHDLSINFREIVASPECIELANEYLNEKVVGQASLEDCVHIATATVHKIDILVSWNFKHIVNIRRIRGYNAINIKNGYASLEIRSPKDLIGYENKEEI
ncbi:MAG: PIN domain-containing protein [Prevotellaceae bacterium]|jgi:predicted nucleic acid-binding protein|nr:PIN domain-containing protein [Prevotellaceae bacterium]